MMGKKIIGIIPSRYESTRLPGKPLVDILGKPMIYHVWKAASQSKHLSKVIVATDDIRILETCRKFGADCVMTSSDIQSGSDRILEAFRGLNEHYDYIINIQGDEPLITPELIDALIVKTTASKADVGTVVKRIDNIDDLFDSNVVKVVLKDDDTALYFSRSPIPYNRDEKPTRWLQSGIYLKHIGIYCYAQQALLKFGQTPQSALEKSESLEQLRLMGNGASYVCLLTDLELMGVDTPDDVKRAEILMKSRLS